MSVNRRSMIAASLGLGAATAAAAAHAAEPKPLRDTFRQLAHDIVPGLQPNVPDDQTALLQTAIDAAASKDVPLALPPGVYRVSDLRLRSGTRIIGAARTTTLQFAGGAAFITADKADGLVLQSLVIDGAFQTFNEERGEGLLNVANSKDIVIDDCEIRNSAKGGLSVLSCSGRVRNTTIADALDFGLKSLDAAGLDVSGNTVTGCGNNGILIWRSKKGEDGSTVTNNRITNIRNTAGGTGEYGNGVNVYLAGSVIVAQNRIADCTYTAVRGNGANNIQIIAHTCERLG